MDDLEEFLTRGVENIYPNKEDVKKRMASGPQTIYWGIDPTGATLHLGHMVCLLRMGQLQKLGHKIIILVGDFTAMIGDPDKIDVRKPLSRKEILANLKIYKKQIGKHVQFSGKNKAEFVFNSKWLSKMKFEDVLKLSSKMTVDQMLKRDMFVRRQEEGRPIYIHEFMYPLMQGYDSVCLDVDGELGGNDQMFNMLAGRHLMKEYSNKDKFVITLKLLVDPKGKKMGKSEGNMVSLLDTPSDMFGKIMSWPDGLIVPGFEICTLVPKKEIEQISESLEKGANPKKVKMMLAEKIVGILIGEKEAVSAKEQFEKTFSLGFMPDTIPEVKGVEGALLVELLLELGLVDSKSEFQRLVKEGAVREGEDGIQIKDPFVKITKSTTYKIGKKRFLKIALD